MIDVNLLPDSKLNKLKEKKSRQLALSISTFVIIVSIGLPVALFVIDFALQRTIQSKQENINSLVSEFKAKENVQEILTVQSQLNKVSDIESNRYYIANLMSLLEYSTPADVAIVSVVAKGTDATFEIQAEASSITEANRFIDTLESIKIKDGDATDESALISPFQAPLVENFADDIDNPTTFSISGTFGPEFGNVSNIEEFVLDPYKLEQSEQKNERVRVRGN